MCVTSMIVDHFSQKYPNGGSSTYVPPAVSREEFDRLRREILEVKELLRKAKEYDEQTGQKDCESEEKISKLRRIIKFAESLGVDMGKDLG